jgi:protoporphyrinogen oxidase
MERVDIIIIGAGISGLSLAHYCAREGLNTLVLEKNDRPGGALHSHSFGGETKDFWIELGAHTCYNSYRNLIGIIEDCRILDRLTRRENVPFKMLIDNQVRSIPSQLDFLELFLSARRLFTSRKEGESMESYYSGIVGRKNFERVFAPAFNAVISQDANEFPSDMLFKRRERRKDVIKKFTLTNGLQAIADAIASQNNIKIITGKEAQTIEIDNDLFRIAATDNSIYGSNYLALATPASAAAQLLNAAFPDVSEVLSRIRVKSVESMGVAVRKELVSFGPVAGLIPKHDSFFSVVSRDAVQHERYRGFTFHFKPDTLDHGAKLKRISEVLGVSRDKLEYAAKKENAVPALSVGHDILMNRLERAIAEKRLYLTGNYFDGLAIEDCVSRSRKEFLRLKAIAVK